MKGFTRKVIGELGCQPDSYALDIVLFGRRAQSQGFIERIGAEGAMSAVEVRALQLKGSRQSLYLALVDTAPFEHPLALGARGELLLQQGSVALPNESQDHLAQDFGTVAKDGGCDV
jgi:hypothetical protein